MSIAEGNGLDFSRKLNDSQANVSQGQNIGTTPMVQQNPQTMRPIDYLTQQMEPEKNTEEISLDTLKKKEIDKIMRAYERGKDVADNYFDGTIRPKLLDRRDM